MTERGQPDLLGLDGRTVIVSGAAGGGIGTSVVNRGRRAGATVIAVSRSAQNLETHIGPLVAEGLPIVPVAADASNDEGIAKVMAQAAQSTRRAVWAGQCRRRRRAGNVDAVNPGHPGGLAGAVHAESRDDGLHEPGGGGAR